MAAKSIKLENTLIIKYKDRMGDNGKEIIKRQRFPKIKASASEQDMFDVAKEIEKLLGKDLDEILMEQESSIIGA